MLPGPCPDEFRTSLYRTDTEPESWVTSDGPHKMVLITKMRPCPSSNPWEMLMQS